MTMIPLEQYFKTEEPAYEGQSFMWRTHTPDLDYENLVKSMGLEIEAYECCGSYQGDYVMLVKEGERRGLLVFAYGSCSGCDSLQACGCMDDVEYLRTNLYSSIAWFASREEFDAISKKWIADNDWKMYDKELIDALEKLNGRV